MQSPPAPPLTRDRNFLWMMGGGLVSMLGDQFTLIALPWLVLRMTGDPLVLGTVLAVMSVPRAAFILLGGALVDRHSPKRVMMLTKHANTLLLGVLAALVLTHGLTLWMVYALALGIGLATAFSIPAGTSMLPHVVAPQQLQAANGLMLTLRQVTMFIGPLLAGGLIALFADGGRGLGVAFALDAFSFALSAWTLAKVQMRPPAAPAPSGRQPVLAAVASGLRASWNDRELRTCFLYWSAVALMISGPIQIALPMLADTRLGEGAGALGLLMGAHGAGTLAGMMVSSVKPTWRGSRLGRTILLVDAIVGALFIPMGWVQATWEGAVLLLAIGLLGGFMQVSVFTWIQRRVPPSMLGRTMSLFMFIFMGLAPVSAAVTGWLMRYVSLGQVFAGSGALLLAIVAVALVASPMRQVSDDAGGKAAA